MTSRRSAASAVPTTTVVVDGSNIATEGRTNPSLAQLDEAVQAFVAEHPHDQVVVVVDATFGHRISSSESPVFEEAILAGELVTPPAGAIGRGDAFVLQIADKAGATVLSNDSFQEFHGTYTWLFDEGRLIGGKPVPAIGWVFVARSPVRGPASRRSVRQAKQDPPASPGKKAPARRPAKASGRAQAKESGKAEPKESGTTAPKARRPARSEPDAAEAAAAPARSGRSRSRPTAATAPTPTATDPAPHNRRRAPAPINEPTPFTLFVAEHPIGGVVEGEVVEFSSHGAYVIASGARCYVPLKEMGDPPPRSAREVLDMGEHRSFVVRRFDQPRRGIDLALADLTADRTTSDTDAKTHAKSTAKSTAKSEVVAPTKRTRARATTASKAPATARASRSTRRATCATSRSTARRTRRHRHARVTFPQSRRHD